MPLYKNEKLNLTDFYDIVKLFENNENKNGENNLPGLVSEEQKNITPENIEAMIRLVANVNYLNN